MDLFPLYDDVGSFPLPENIDIEWYRKFYWVAYKAFVNKNQDDILEHTGINNYFINPFLESFRLKLKAGVEVINYPQHIDMYNQFLKPISDYEIEPGLISPENTFIPEMFIIENFAKEHYEKTGNSFNVKICVTGPIELYIKQQGFTVYLDIALNFAKSVNSFIKSAIINNKYINTSVVALDEPSFGYVDMFNINNDDIINIFDKSLEGINATNQIHLHTLKKATLAMQTKNIDVLTCEYASDPTNKIPKRELDQYDKFIRVGIARTNIDSIVAEKLDLGMSMDELGTLSGKLSLIDSEDRIRKNLLKAIEMYGDRLKYVGPDCGLGGWPLPQIAFELLNRTNKVIEQTKKEL
jgi:5-methyltetrahydropteroyltriglutamate--homocysteine methyltransferase